MYAGETEGASAISRNVHFFSKNRNILETRRVIKVNALFGRKKEHDRRANMKRGIRLGAASAAHFLVDFACAFAIFRRLPGAGGTAELLLLYNFCAFALQMPLGVLADRMRCNLALAAGGCALAAAGFLPLPVMASAAVLGVGNALFHVGAGLEVLTDWRETCAPLGVFVSPGAVGLYIGGMLGRAQLTPALLPAVLLLGAAVWLLAAQRAFRPDLRSENPPAELPRLPLSTLAALCGLFAVVILRSLVGLDLRLSWKSGVWGAVVVCALALGKAAGGFAADRFGMTRTAAVTLTASAGLFCLAGNPVCGTAAIFLFNMSMPLTLTGAARLLPGARGFAFGLLTFALFLGLVPVYFGAAALSGGTAAVLAAVSALALTACLKGAVKA